jgi:sialate O-acetylesterase
MLSLAPLFSDYVVFQRDKPIRIWGTAKELPVTVTIGGNSVTVTPERGAWSAELPALAAAEQVPVKVQSGGETITLAHAAVGEVWIAGGQSNMEWPLRYDYEWKTIIPQANDPLLRFYDEPHVSYEGQEKEDDYSHTGFWRTFNPGDAPWFSAVGTYFGLDLRKALNVPVGIVGCNWGGTSAACWMPEAYLQTPTLRQYLTDSEKSCAALDMKTYREQYRAQITRAWPPEAMELMEQINRGELPFETLMERFKDAPPPPMPLPVGPMDPYRPVALYDLMLKKVAPVSARGIIWYQGETDQTYPQLYEELLTAMIRAWRELFGEALPFLEVQLAPYEGLGPQDGPNFPGVRDAQARVAKKVAGVWMASIMDVGAKKDIHPKQKRQVGERLALLARGKVYGETALLCESPEPGEITRERDGFTVNFKHAEGGLTIRGGGTVEGVDAFGEDGAAVETVCTVDGSALRISAAKPIAQFSFAWRPYVEVNLYNAAGIPVAPFRYPESSV